MFLTGALTLCVCILVFLGIFCFNSKQLNSVKPCVLLGWGESKVNNSPGMEASLGARQIAVPRLVKTLGRL